MTDWSDTCSCGGKSVCLTCQLDDLGMADVLADPFVSSLDDGLARLRAAVTFEVSHQRAEAPEGAKGWADQDDSALFLAGGHGLNVAPDASPEGTQAEARRRTADGTEGEPSNALTAADLSDEEALDALDEAIYAQTGRHPAA